VQTLAQTDNFLHLKISKEDTLGQAKSIGFIFGEVESMKDEFDIGEYEVTPTSLEQVFNYFAKEKEILRMESQRH